MRITSKFQMVAVVFIFISIFIFPSHASAAAGDLDTTFSSDGMVTTDITAAADQAYSIAIQTDGKIVVVGYSLNGADEDFAVARYNTDGSLDTTFGGDGKVDTDLDGFGASNDRAYAVAIQDDGKIVVAGYYINFMAPNSEFFALVRYNTDGSLDSTFDLNGDQDGIVADAYITCGPECQGHDSQAYSIAIQDDGKIVAAGYTENGLNGNDFAVARFETDGDLDLTFSADGWVTVDMAVAGQDIAYSVAIQDDGKIVAGGRYANGANWNFGLIRLDTNGVLDATFDDDGKVNTPLAAGGDTDWITALAIQGDGKIVAVGTATSEGPSFMALARYDTNGALDATFSDDGKLTVGFEGNDFGTSVVLQPDGKIVAAGYSSDGADENFAVARFGSDGTLDTSFSGDGMAVLPFGGDGDNDGAFALALQTDGKVVAAGYATTGTDDFALLRLWGTTCGNGTVEGAEECDDGNAVSGDGCSDACQLEEDAGDGEDVSTEIEDANPGVDLGALTGSVALTAPDPRGAPSVLSIEEACDCLWGIDPATLVVFSDDTACETILTPQETGDGILSVGIDCGEEGAGTYQSPITVEAIPSDDGADTGIDGGAATAGGCSLRRGIRLQ